MKLSFKNRCFCLLGFLVVVAAMAPYLVSLPREVGLAVICTMALAGMCLTGTLVMTIAFITILKRLKETRRHVAPPSVDDVELLNLPQIFAGKN